MKRKLKSLIVTNQGKKENKTELPGFMIYNKAMMKG